MKRKLERSATEEQNPAKLLKAITVIDIAEAKRLINEMDEESLNAVDEYGRTVLHLAAKGRHKEVCKLLVAKMTLEAVGAIDKWGKTALHLAASKGCQEVYKVLIKNTHEKKLIELLDQNNSALAIYKVICGIVIEFINSKFLTNEVSSIDFDAYQIKLLKLYQIVGQENLLNYNSNKSADNPSEKDNSFLCINNVNNYIIKHYFTLIGVCKSVNKDSSVSILVLDNNCMSYMLSYLAPYSLSPELLTTSVELLGTGLDNNSEKGNEETQWISLL